MWTLAESDPPIDAACLRIEVEIQPIDFGAYRTGPADLRGRGSIRLTCFGADAGVGGFQLRLGAGSSGRSAQRTLVAEDGSGSMDYNLYLDPARTVVWGDGSDGTRPIEGSFPSAAARMDREHMIYGQVPGNQRVTVGRYSDTLLVTVEF